VQINNLNFFQQHAFSATDVAVNFLFTNCKHTFFETRHGQLAAAARAPLEQTLAQKILPRRLYHEACADLSVISFLLTRSLKNKSNKNAFSNTKPVAAGIRVMVINSDRHGQTCYRARPYRHGYYQIIKRVCFLVW
jgi:hypothetical protein